MHLEGIDHLTAITAQPAACREFYVGVLGLEALDAPGGELAVAAPGGTGGALRFMHLPDSPSGNAGRGLIHRLSWRVGRPQALDLLGRRLEAAGLATELAVGPAGLPMALRFHDPEGLGHELRVFPGGTGQGIEALAGVRAFVAGSVQSFDLLAGRLGFEGLANGEWGIGEGIRRSLYACDEPPTARPVQGAGTVHHVAWRCRAGEERAWRQRVIGMGAVVSRLHEEGGARSFYFREPDGVLFAVTSAERTLANDRTLARRPPELPPRIARPVGLRVAA